MKRWQRVPSRWLDLGHGQNAEGHKGHETKDGEQHRPHSHDHQTPVVPVRETLRGAHPQQWQPQQKGSRGQEMGRLEGRSKDKREARDSPGVLYTHCYTKE